MMGVIDLSPPPSTLLMLGGVLLMVVIGVYNAMTNKPTAYAKYKAVEHLPPQPPKLERKDDLLVITLPKEYDLTWSWPLFTADLPNAPEFTTLRHIVVDGTALRELGDLGMGAELYALRERLLAHGGQTFSLAGWPLALTHRGDAGGR